MRIIIADGKHSTRYLDASTDEQWARSALKLLTERWEQRWYGDPDSMFDWYFREAVLTVEQIENLPTSELKQQESAKLAQRSRAEREKAEYQDWYDEAKRVVETQDVSLVAYGRKGRSKPLAWDLLDLRGDGEYENVQLEDVEAP